MLWTFAVHIEEIVDSNQTPL